MASSGNAFDTFIRMWREHHGNAVTPVSQVAAPIRALFRPKEARHFDPEYTPSDARVAAKLQAMRGLDADGSTFEPLFVDRPGEAPRAFVLAPRSRFCRTDADPKAASPAEWKAAMHRRARAFTDAEDLRHLPWEGRLPLSQERAYREIVGRYAAAHEIDQPEAEEALARAGIAPPAARL
jgi:hypothetical protein